MAPVVERWWDSAAALVRRHPKKIAAIGLAGAWYQPVGDVLRALVTLLPSPSAIAEVFRSGSWPDWSVSWVTGPVGTVLLLLLWRTNARAARLEVETEL